MAGGMMDIDKELPLDLVFASKVLLDVPQLQREYWELPELIKAELKRLQDWYGKNPSQATMEMASKEFWDGHWGAYYRAIKALYVFVLQGIAQEEKKLSDKLAEYGKAKGTIIREVIDSSYGKGAYQCFEDDWMNVNAGKGVR